MCIHATAKFIEWDQVITVPIIIIMVSYSVTFHCTVAM